MDRMRHAPPLLNVFVTNAKEIPVLGSAHTNFPPTPSWPNASALLFSPKPACRMILAGMDSPVGVDVKVSLTPPCIFYIENH